MAATMKKARLRTNHSVILWAADYDKRTHGDVVCCDGRCVCPVIGVSANTKNVFGKQVHVAAFFRLPPNAQKEGRGHSPRCRYNIQKTVDRLVARSREIKSFDKDGEALLERGKGGKAEFRLHILMEALSQVPLPATIPGVSNGSGMEPEFVGTRYVRSRRHLKPYLKMAKAILSLQARVQARPELEEWIRLIYGDQSIPWSDYFFDLPDYGELYRFLAAKGQYTRRGEKDRPIAVVVEIRQQTIRSTRFNDYQIKCRAMIGNPAVVGDMALMPVIYTPDQELAQLIAKPGFILVCAVPTIELLRKPTKAGLRPFSDLKLKVAHRAQVCQYSPMP